MANIVITTTGNSIVVDFGDYYSETTRIQYQKASFYKLDIEEVHLHPDRVSVKMRDNALEWELCKVATTGCIIVDTISGVAPASLSDLFDKMTALRG